METNSIIEACILAVLSLNIVIVNDNILTERLSKVRGLNKILECIYEYSLSFCLFGMLVGIVFVPTIVLINIFCQNLPDFFKHCLNFMHLIFSWGWRIFIGVIFFAVILYLVPVIGSFVIDHYLKEYQWLVSSGKNKSKAFATVTLKALLVISSFVLYVYFYNDGSV